VPIYLGLIVVQGIYAYKFMKNLWYLITNVNEMDADTIMLAVLNLIDVVMIANLLVMVTLGGYEIFVSKLRTKNHPDQPEWMSHVNATVLKVKLSMSIISISSIHLLQTFVNASKIPEKNDYVGSDYSFCFLDFSDCDGLYRQNPLQYKPQKPLIHKVRSN
jgi:uncharacterized protein (TIGR00645 family)